MIVLGDNKEVTCVVLSCDVVNI